MSRRKVSDRRYSGRPGAGGRPGPKGRGSRPHERPPGRPGRAGAGTKDGRYWIYGHHAALAAIRNPRRQTTRLLTTAKTQAQFAADIEAARARLGDRLAIVTAEEISAQVGNEAVHQGLAVEVLPLPIPAIDRVLADAGPQAMLLVLDQVTDPHNVGAILRSAAAFGVTAVVTTHHHSPPESGSLAKAASGGLEQVPLLRVANLAQALQSMKKAGFWCLGLAAEASQPLAGASLTGRIAFVLGAEGAGLRRLTRAHCDVLVRLPSGPGLIQLNVSNAAAVALYERSRTNSGNLGEPDKG